MDYALDAGAGGGCRLGVVLLCTEVTFDYEARAMLAGRAANLMTARIPCGTDVTPDGLLAMAPEMARTAALLPRGLSAMAYSCISGAMVTPYVPQVSAPMIARLAQAGIEVVDAVSFDQKEDWPTARAEAIFTSCTNLRTFGMIEPVEAETGLPVIISNQALLWDLLRRAWVAARGWGPGRLF